MSVLLPFVHGLHDLRTGSVQYVVACPQTRQCAIIDPVLDFDEKSGATATESADALLAYIASQNLHLEWILDTHPHADHFSAAGYLKDKTGAKTAIGVRVIEMQKLWAGIYNWTNVSCDGHQWDRLLLDDETLEIGALTAKIVHAPGHTLASISLLIGDAAFIHDTLFMPDSGTARADFPGGSASALWRSIQSILALPKGTRLFTGHDYGKNGRKILWESRIENQLNYNAMIAGMTEQSFVKKREARDKSLPMPKLILAALQVNLNGGRLPEPEVNGVRYLKIPIDVFPDVAWE